MKLNKIATACALAFAFTPAMADSSQFQGVSAALGVSFNGGSTNLVLGDTSLDLGKSSQVAAIDLGYTFSVSPSFVIGAGVAYDVGKTKFGAVEGDDLVARLEASNTYAIYAQPTWLLNNSTGLYAKLGFSRAKGTLSGEFDDNGNATPFSESDNFNGISYALGVKTFIDKNLFVQVEAGMVNLKSKEIGDTDPVTIKPKMSRATVSIGYRF